MYFPQVAIIGVGLLGGSVGLALQRAGLARRVIGFGRREGSLAQALERKCITDYTTHLDEAVHDAGLVIVATPVEQTADFVAAAAKGCGPGTLITDVGSTKESICRSADAALAGGAGTWASFVGSHPLAGSEKTGPIFAKANLFDDRMVVVTPTENSRPDAVEQIDTLWQKLGAKTCRMHPAEHDAAVAITSHLPHLVASLVAAITPEELLKLTAGGWQDTTRVASGDVELWRQILLDNRPHVLLAVEKFATVLASFREALEQADGAAIAQLLEAGKRTRDALGS